MVVCVCVCGGGLHTCVYVCVCMHAYMCVCVCACIHVFVSVCVQGARTTHAGYGDDDSKASPRNMPLITHPFVINAIFLHPGHSISDAAGEMCSPLLKTLANLLTFPWYLEKSKTSATIKPMTMLFFCVKSWPPPPFQWFGWVETLFGALWFLFVCLLLCFQI